MSIPPLPAEADDETMQLANALHSFCIHLLRGARKADAESGLSPERLSLLSVLVYAGPQTITALARIESVSAPAISRIVTYLEKGGLVRRRRNRQDARIVAVEATKKGRTLMDKGRMARLALIAAQLETLTPAQRRKLAIVKDISLSPAK